MKEQEQVPIGTHKLISQDPQIRQQFAKNQKNYFNKAQFAFYADLSKIQSMRIFTKSTYDVECNVIFSYHADKYQEQQKQNIQYYILQTLQEELPKIKNQYSLAYVHNTLSDYFIFKDILLSLPQKYFQKLKSIYIIQPSLILKIYQWFSYGPMNRLLNRYIEYADSIQQIEHINKIMIKKTGTRSKMKFGQQTPGGQGSHTPVPRNSVQIIKNGLYGKPLSNYKLGTYNAPLLIELLIHHLIKKQQYLEAQGILRKNCDIQQLQILQLQLIDKNYDYLNKVEDPYVIAGCLKKIFHNLETPLFSYEIYNAILQFRSNSTSQQIIFMRKILQMMAPLNKNTLLLMCAFFIKGIISNQSSNKMSAYNLSVVLGPCFFRPQHYDLQDLINSGKFAKIIMHMLQKFQEILDQETVKQYYLILQKLKESY